MKAIVDRINSAVTYEFDVVAEYSEQIIDPMEEVAELRVDVVS